MHMSAHKWTHTNSREKCNVAGQDRKLIQVNWWLMNGRIRHQYRAATTKGESIWHQSPSTPFSIALIRSLSTKDESSAWSRFDDQVLGRWCGVTGGSSACVFVWLYVCVCWCDRGKSIPTVMREVPTALPSGIEKTFSFSLPSVLFHPLHFSSSVHLLLLQYHPFWHFQMM